MFGVPPGVLLGAVVLGAIHGAEPGHGWPVAAAYAADRANRWLAGAVAGLVIGAGHLVSSLAVVGLFFLVKRQFAIEAVTEPLRVGGTTIGSPLGIVAGVLLIALGVREYRSDGHGHSHGHGDHAHDDADDHPHGHSDAHDDADGPPHSHTGDHGHGHGNDHDHDHDHGTEHSHGNDHDHDHDHGTEHSHGHDHDHSNDHGTEHSHGHDHGHGGLDATDGLWGIAVSAFVLGFAHEEEFEIIAICAGTDACLPAMTAYALTVVAVITVATLALVAGLEQFEQRAERFAAVLPTLSAAVLVLLGVAFLFGVV